MSDAKWSPEPWKVDDQRSGDGTVDIDASPTGHNVDAWTVATWVEPEDARRIVAAVNAVAGIPTEALERGDLKKLIDLAAWPYEGEYGSRCEEHEDGCFDCEMVAALVAIGRLK